MTHECLDTSHLARAGCRMLWELFIVMGPDTRHGVVIIITLADSV